MFTSLVCNDRNNAMENWRSDDWVKERSASTRFSPPPLLTAQIINSMPLSIDGGCHTSRRRPLPHKDPQPGSIFRLLQRCCSEVGRLKKVPATSLQSDSTSLFRRRAAVALQWASMQLFFTATCSWQSWHWGKVGCAWGAHWWRPPR